MPLDVRKISVNFAVLFFFSISIVTIIIGLPPFTCCKRAILGAVIVYIIAGIAARLINMILKNKTKDTEEILNAIFLAANKFGNKRKWQDDSTVVVIKRIE